MNATQMYKRAMIGRDELIEMRRAERREAAAELKRLRAKWCGRLARLLDGRVVVVGSSVNRDLSAVVKEIEDDHYVVSGGNLWGAELVAGPVRQ